MLGGADGVTLSGGQASMVSAALFVASECASGHEVQSSIQGFAKYIYYHRYIRSLIIL